MTRSLIVLALVSILPATGADPGQVTLSVDFEGANPSRAEDIVKQGPNQFLIHPFSEDPSDPRQKFTLLVAAINPAAHPVDLVVSIEWNEPRLVQVKWMLYRSVLMAGRGEDWQHYDATSIEGSLAQFKIPLPPGRTYLALSPKYTIEDLEASIKRLPHGCAETIEVGHSREGRKIVGLKIARGRAENRKTILLIARTHPWESAGSYAAEGALEYLCSPEAVPLLDRFSYFVVPMANPDGVVLGSSHLTGIGGVDLNLFSSDPAAIALKSLVDRTQPAGFLDYHQWVFVRDWIRTFIPEPEMRARLFLNLEKTTFFRRGWQLTDESTSTGRANDLRYYAMTRWNTKVAVPSFVWADKSTAQMRQAGALMLQAFSSLLKDAEPGREERR